MVWMVTAHSTASCLGWVDTENASPFLLGNSKARSVVQTVPCSWLRNYKLNSERENSCVLFYDIKPRFWRLKFNLGDFPGLHWLRICLPMQKTLVWSMVQEDPTCRRATKPMHQNFWSPSTLRACTLQQEIPLHWEACTLQGRAAPTCSN